MDKRKLYIGVDSNLKYFTVDHKPLTRGLALIGQSGCGKSFLLGRIIEELVRTTTNKTRILVIDTNADFYNGLELKTSNENTKSFSSVLNKYNSGLISKEAFRNFFHEEESECNMIADRKEFKEFEIYGKKGFNFSFSWLLDDFFSRFLPILRAGISERFLIDAFRYVFQKGKTLKEYSMFLFDLSHGKLFDQYTVLNSEEAYASLYNDISKPFVVQEFPDKEGQKTFNDNLFSKKRVAFVEMERIQDNRVRVQSLLYILYFLWEKHIEMTKKLRAGEISPEDAKRTFLIIDEAHNFAPDETEDPYLKLLGEMIHKIAAEGRKYGLHLILATQRPNKLKKGLLGELDNAIIMKMNSHSDLEHLANEMRILDVKLIEPCLHFQGQGNAIAIGEMTGMAPYARIFKAAPRRTLEGGIDIEGF
ncbi:ATP-binding protein [bacterium]|nr:ATP-binding protein [bacterium]